jgi:hypothetical protein
VVATGDPVAALLQRSVFLDYSTQKFFPVVFSSPRSNTVTHWSRRAFAWVRPLPYASRSRRHRSITVERSVNDSTTVIEEEDMGGALGIGTPTYNPTQAGLFGNPWFGSPFGMQTQPLVNALQHLLHLQYAQQQQLQQLGQLVPQQLQLIQHLIQIAAHQQQPYQQWQQPSGWLSTQAAQQPIFGGQPGYVM